jgi:asparagine N-glycosylation enzyme membrane subunit Stt3
MVWWDYGYWIIAAAHRVPVAIPTQQGAPEAGAFFTETDDARAKAGLDARQSRYVFVDELLPFRRASATTVLGKFESMLEYAGRDTGRYYATFLYPNQGYRAVYLYFPDYYRSIAFRLAVLGGGGLHEPRDASVVSWSMQTFADGRSYRVVSAMREFSRYSDAVQYLEQLGPGNHAIVGKDPDISPVPLDPVAGLRRVYRTPSPGVFQQGSVQIFEVSP